MEIWKDCVDYPELFEVSNLGNFRNKRNKKVLKQCLHQHGYLHLATKIGGRKGKSVCFKMHREVAKAFLKNLKNLPCVNHKDGAKTNNNLDNLEWTTYSENSRHAISLGLSVVPTNQLKLTNSQIKFIKDHHIPRDRDFGARALGRKFNVDKSTIQRAFHGLAKDT